MNFEHERTLCTHSINTLQIGSNRDHHFARLAAPGTLSVMNFEMAPVVIVVIMATSKQGSSAFRYLQQFDREACIPSLIHDGLVECPRPAFRGAWRSISFFGEQLR